MFSLVRRHLFVALALILGSLPTAASAATVELMTVRVVQTRTPTETIKLGFSADNGAETPLVKTVSKNQPWQINRTVSYQKSVQVRMYVMNANGASLIQANVLNTKAGIYEAVFQAGGSHYALTYKVTPTPPPTVAPTYVLQINWIFANKTQEGEDELQFKFSADGGKETTLTHTMRNKTVWNVRKDIPFRTKAIIRLYDEDFAFDDFIGSATYTPSQVGAAWNNTNFRHSDGTFYQVQYRVIQK